MKLKNHRHSKKQSGGECGCQIPNLNPFSGGCSTCNLPMNGGGFDIPPTAILPSTNETYYPLNSYQNDPNMMEFSTRTQGVPISHTLNETGGNIISLIGGKKHKRTNKKTKKNKQMKKTKKNKQMKKTRKNKQMKKQKGGINLGQSAISSYLGPGHYNSLLGSKLDYFPDWNRSIFTNPASLNNTGFSKTNPPLV